MKRLLVNGVYSNAVGHVIEALMWANSLRNADPDAEIKMLLNRRAPLELLRCAAPLRIATIPVDLEHRFGRLRFLRTRFRRVNGLLGSTCDQAVAIHDGSRVTWQKGIPLKRFHDDFFDWSERARVPVWWGSPVWRRNSWAQNTTGPAVMSSSLELTVPSAELDFASSCIGSGGPVISLLLGSANPEKSPPLAFWRELAARLLEQWPEAVIVLVGLISEHYGGTANTTREDVAAFQAMSPRIRSGFNVGIVRQMALFARSDVLIGPHSGMAFAAQCVGTPWLALSGWNYYEYLTNEVPFHSLHPDCPFFPCDAQSILAECRQAHPVKCLGLDALRSKIPAIVHAAKGLIHGDHTYTECIARHRANLGEIEARTGRSLGVWENIRRPRSVVR